MIGNKIAAIIFDTYSSTELDAATNRERANNAAQGIALALAHLLTKSDLESLDRGLGELIKELED
jgi:hypothetical protein